MSLISELQKRRIELQRELAAIDVILELYGAKPPQPREAVAGKSSRGEVKNWFLHLLDEAGPKGMPWKTVTEEFKKAYPQKTVRPLYRFVSEFRYATKGRSGSKITRITKAGKEELANPSRSSVGVPNSM